jgi:predicted amidophosphoribosyltransferase
MFRTNIDIANDFFKLNPDFSKPESVRDCHLVKEIGDLLYISCYIKTNTSLYYNVIYDPQLWGNLVKTKEKAFAEDDYWSGFNKGNQFDKNISDEGLGAALVVLDKKAQSIYNIYYFKDTYCAEFPVEVQDVVEGKVVVRYFEYDYVFENGLFIYLTFVDSHKFLKLDYLWIAYPYWGYDASCSWHFINFKDNIESPIHLFEEGNRPEYTDCYYDFEKCLFIFSNEEGSMTMDFQTLTSITEEDKKNKELNGKRWEEEKKKNLEIRQRITNEMVLLKAKLESAVSSWDTIGNSFHYNYLFNYFPTTCNFVATEEEWAHRRLIWNFKNDPDKNIPLSEHTAALEEIIPLIKQKLSKTFGDKYLQFMTLVCIPASTSKKNYHRYSDFSKKLCEETYMKNAYDYIMVFQDGMSKNHPENHTGHSIQPDIRYKEDFFKGRYVLLFDDVITKGDTMLRYKDAMEKLGAIVIGGMCLGKTRHERPVQSGHYTNDYDEELPF